MRILKIQIFKILVFKIWQGKDELTFKIRMFKKISVIPNPVSTSSNVGFSFYVKLEAYFFSYRSVLKKSSIILSPPH